MTEQQQQDAVPTLKAPKGTCDTHVHFYNDRFPLAPTSWLSPPNYSVPQYRAMCDRVGIDRVVIVQPTSYGADNRCILDASAQFGPDSRLVVVVDTTVSDTELQGLHDLGARGVRFHMLRGGVLGWDIMEEMAARVAPFGWHLQVQLDGFELPEREAMLKSLGSNVVIDHMGRYSRPIAPDHPAFQSLLRLVDTGRFHVKLSGSYLISAEGAPLYSDVAPLARTLVEHAPERMLWASDWPHPSEEHKPDDAWLIDLLLQWAPSEAQRQAILVDNPARVYGF
jgi:D-galactarolactone isomerase